MKSTAMAKIKISKSYLFLSIEPIYITKQLPTEFKHMGYNNTVIQRYGSLIIINTETDLDHKIVS